MQQHEEKAQESGQEHRGHKTVPCSAVPRCYSGQQLTQSIHMTMEGFQPRAPPSVPISLSPNTRAHSSAPQAALGPEQSGKGRLACTEHGAARTPPGMAVTQRGSFLHSLLPAAGSAQCLVGPAQRPAKVWHCTRHSRHRAAAQTVSDNSG